MVKISPNVFLIFIFLMKKVNWGALAMWTNLIKSVLSESPNKGLIMLISCWFWIVCQSLVHFVSDFTLFYREANFKSITPLLDGLQTLWEDWNDEEIAYRVKEIMIVSLEFLFFWKLPSSWEWGHIIEDCWQKQPCTWMLFNDGSLW